MSEGLSQRWSLADAKAIYDRLRSAAAYYAVLPDDTLEAAGLTREGTHDWARRLFDAADIIDEVWVQRLPPED
jgi:hypothetical protein